jgi:hypothetical protein
MNQGCGHDVRRVCAVDRTHTKLPPPPPRASGLGQWAWQQTLFGVCMVTLAVAVGLAAQLATGADAKWPLFVLSLAFAAVVGSGVALRLRRLDSAWVRGTIEGKAFRFLAPWALAVGALYPLVFVLDNARVVGFDGEAVMHCVLDILSQGVWVQWGRGGGERLHAQLRPTLTLTTRLMRRCVWRHSDRQPRRHGQRPVGGVPAGHDRDWRGCPHPPCLLLAPAGAIRRDPASHGLSDVVPSPHRPL